MKSENDFSSCGLVLCVGQLTKGDYHALHQTKTDI